MSAWKAAWQAIFPPDEAGGLWRIPRWGILAGLVLIFSVAAWSRFSLPPVPIFTPDSMGFAGPGLHHHVEGVMLQTHQRGFFYPLIIRGVMVWGVDMSMLTHVQHTAWLAAGLLWWMLWISWCRRLPGPWLRRIVGPVIGLFLLLVFLWSANGIFLGHNARPEGVFPLFAIAQITLTCWTFFLAASRPVFPKLAALAAFLSVLAGAASVGVKPSWALAWGAPLVMVVFLFRDGGWRSLPVWGVLAAGLAAAGIWLMGMPFVEKSLSWKADTAPQDFLAETLVAVHAPQIVEFWAKPGRWDKLPASDRQFLLSLQRGIEDSQKRPHSYHNLGFDPDFIHYRTRILMDLPVPEEQRIEYLKGWYLPILTRAPWMLIPKISNQFALALVPRPSILYRNSLRLARSYKRSLDGLNYLWETRPANLIIPWAPYWERTSALAAESPTEKKVTPAINNFFLRCVQFLLLPSLLMSLAAGVKFFIFPSPESRFLVMPFFWALFSLAAVAVVAIVHSFDIDRYQQSLAFLHLLVTGGGALLFCGAINSYFSRRRKHKGAETGT